MAWTWSRSNVQPVGEALSGATGPPDRSHRDGTCEDSGKRMPIPYAVKTGAGRAAASRDGTMPVIMVLDCLPGDQHGIDGPDGVYTDDERIDVHLGDDILQRVADSGKAAEHDREQGNVAGRPGTHPVKQAPDPETVDEAASLFVPNGASEEARSSSNSTRVPPAPTITTGPHCGSLTMPNATSVSPWTISATHISDPSDIRDMAAVHNAVSS